MARTSKSTKSAPATAGSETAAQPGQEAAPETAETSPDRTAPAPAVTGGNAGGLSFDDLLSVHRSQMEALAQASQAFLDGMAAINREMVEFGERRAEAFVDSSKSVPQRGQLNELFSFQIDYATSATQAYLDEATRLFGLGVKTSQDSWAPLQESAATVFGNGLRKSG